MLRHRPRPFARADPTIRPLEANKLIAFGEIHSQLRFSLGNEFRKDLLRTIACLRDPAALIWQELT